MSNDTLLSEQISNLSILDISTEYIIKGNTIFPLKSCDDDLYNTLSFGDIYMITSPSGNSYIGQAVRYLPSGKKWGYIKRVKQHMNEAKNNKKCSVALDNALVKYNFTNFKITHLKICKVEDLNYWESYYVLEHNTFHPNGYNLTTGGSNGRQSAATIEKKRESMMGKNLGKIYPKRDRINPDDIDLPKYVRSYKDSSGKEGYRVSHHPILKEKSFLGKTKSMEDKLKLALEYLNA